MQTNQDLQYTVNSQAANYYIPDPVPIQAASESSALVPLKPISKPQWQATPTSNSNSAELNTMYDKHNINSGQVAQPQSPFGTPSSISQNIPPSYSSTLNQHYYDIIHQKF